MEEEVVVKVVVEKMEKEDTVEVKTEEEEVAEDNL